MAHISYNYQPVLGPDLDYELATLAYMLASSISGKIKNDPSFDDVVNLLNSIANNIVRVDDHFDPPDEDDYDSLSVQSADNKSSNKETNTSNQ